MEANVSAYIAEVLGPQRLPVAWLGPLSAVYAVVLLTGCVGNACTCLVIARNPYMQTATNCYLFNLAVADMLTLLCAMPLELYTLWHQYPWELGTVMCELRALVPEATAYASILTIVAFSTERYVAICRIHAQPPPRSAARRRRRALRIVALIWAVSLAAASPFAAYTAVNQLPGLPQSAWCGFPFNQPERHWEALLLTSTILFFAAPLSVIAVLYACIASSLRESVLTRNASLNGGATPEARAKIRSRRVVVRMLAAVVAAFFLCWAPFHAQRLLFVYVTLYGEWTEVLRRVNQDLFLLAGCFYYFNSTINPILYSVMSNRFRVAFREKLCTGGCLWWRSAEKKASRGGGRVLSSASHSSVRSYSSSYQGYRLKAASVGAVAGVSAVVSVAGSPSLAPREDDLAIPELNQFFKTQALLREEESKCVDCSKLQRVFVRPTRFYSFVMDLVTGSSSPGRPVESIV